LKNGSMVENVYRGEEMPLETGVETTLKVSGIKTELTSGESYTFYVFDSLNKLSPLAMTFGDGAYLEPSLAEFRADDSELNDAYDFITAEDGGFKGVYCFFEQYKETETIEALLDSGVNSFIVFLLNKENYTEDGMKSIIEKWKAVIGDAKLYTVVAYGSDSEFNNRAFGTFIDKYGDDISAPCPLSKEYWNKVYGERSTLAEKLGADGCLADMEMYAAKRTHFYSECYCDKCWNSFVKYAFYDETLEYSNAQTPEAEEGEKRNFCERAAYISENGLSDEYRNYQENSLIGILSDIRNSLPEDFMLGYLIYYEDVAGITKGLGSPNAPCLVLDEYTYSADGSEGYDYSNRTWGHLRTTYDVGNPAILLLGFWSTISLLIT